MNIGSVNPGTDTSRILAEIDAAIHEAKKQAVAEERAAILQTITTSLGVNGNGHAPGRRNKAPAISMSNGSVSAHGGKGPQANAERVLEFVRANPGSSAAQITSALKLDRSAMVSVRRILGRKLKTRGQKRGTTYFAANGA